MASDISDLLSPDLVTVGVAARTKKALLGELAALAAPAVATDAGLIAERLAAREKLGSTGFGGGVAIPHARLDGLSRIVAVVARLAQPVAYKAVDDAPVDLVAMLLSPVDAGAEHLKALARVSRRFRDAPFVAKLRGAGSRDALYALLADADPGDAARAGR